MCGFIPIEPLGPPAARPGRHVSRRRAGSCARRFLPLLAPLAFLITSLLTPPAAAGGRLTDVRAAPWDDRFRVVLDLTGEVDYHPWVLTGPDRIAIDLRHTPGDEFRLPRVNDWLVVRLRLNYLRSGTAQVVLDLSRAAKYKVFTLPAGNGKPHRIVCDVFRPAEPEDGAAGRPWVVVIDPGHGGRDPGAVEGRLHEKTIVLDVARRLAKRLNEQPDVIAYLTRERDVFMSLQRRVRKAQAAGADVFISVHVNGCRARSARGAEVFYLSLKGATNVAARELAALENKEAIEEEDPLLGEIADLPFAVDLIKTDTIRRSSLLAEAVLDALCAGGLAASRGVKQANFVVLRSCRVPSVLIELGFISNPLDARRLASESYRQALAENIVSGLLEYRQRYARRNAGVDVLPSAGRTALQSR